MKIILSKNENECFRVVPCRDGCRGIGSAVSTTNTNEATTNSNAAHVSTTKSNVSTTKSNVSTTKSNVAHVAPTNSNTAPINADHASTPTIEYKDLCVICLASEKTHAFVPCGHMCVCEICGPAIMTSSRSCPMCRTNVSSTLHIYRSKYLKYKQKYLKLKNEMK